MDWRYDIAVVQQFSTTFGLPGSIKDFIKRFQLFCQAIWLGHPPSPRATYRCLHLGQVSSPWCTSYAEFRVTCQSMGPPFSKKKKNRNTSAEHFETTCTTQGWVSDEFERRLHRNIYCLPKCQGIVLSPSTLSIKTTCGFRVHWVFLILLISKKKKHKFSKD